MKPGDRVRVIIGAHYAGYTGVVDHISTRGIQRDYPVIVRFGEGESVIFVGYRHDQLQLLTSKEEAL